jgi:hypothetical protein
VCPRRSQWFKLIVLALALILIVPILGACGGGKEGRLPSLKVGDNWTYEVSDQGSYYSMTVEVIDQGKVNGIDCWVMQMSFDPNYMGVSTSTVRYDKANLHELQDQFSTTESGVTASVSDIYSYDPSDYSNFPMEVGKQATVTQTDTETDIIGGELTTDTTTTTLDWNIEAVERVTVTAGTFKCFKYTDGSSTYWYSDKIKADVKVVQEDGSTMELKSYSV